MQHRGRQGPSSRVLDDGERESSRQVHGRQSGRTGATGPTPPVRNRVGVGFKREVLAECIQITLDVADRRFSAMTVYEFVKEV